MIPWKTVGEPRLLASEFGKKLIVQKFFNPNTGETADYSLFGSVRVPAIVMPVTEKGEVVLVRTFRHAALMVSLEFPGGNKDGEEGWSVVAERELREETGYEADEIIPLSRNGIWFEPQSLAIPFFPFLALGCRLVGNQELDQNEEIESVLMPLHSWINTVFSGAITDSKSITISALSMPHLKERNLI